MSQSPASLNAGDKDIFSGLPWLQQAPIGFFMSTPAGRYISTNPAQARLLGYETPEEFIASITDIATQLYVDPLERQKFQNALETHGEVVNFECRFRHRAGSVVWGSVNAFVVRDEDGNVLHYQGFTTDITARKKAEEDLRRSEQQYRELIENINDVVFTVDLNGRITYLSPSAHNIFPDASTLIGSSYIEIVDPQDAERIRRAWNDVLNNRLQTNEYRLCLKPGKTIWVRTSSRPAYRDGVLVGVVGVLVEISAQKKVEEALRESEELFRTLIESAPVSVLLVQNGCYIYGNPASARLLGLENHEALIGQSALETIAPESRALVQERMRRIESGADNTPMEMQILRPDGGRVWCISTSVRALMNNVPTAIVVGQDITRQKKVEGRLIRAREEADAANRSKSEFLANMSHELRTPLNGIMGMMQLLQTTRLDDEQQNFVSMAIKSSERLTRLLTDLLDISKIEAGKMEIVDEEFSPRELADSVSELFSVNASASGIALECIIDPAMPSRLVGGIARLRQILFNLVGNSLKFTERGTVRLEMTPLSSTRGDELRVLFSVFDTGIGIPDDKFEELFKPFAQMEGTYTRKYQGAGLGLAIVRRLVGLLHGHIFLESALGQGTEVHVILPFKLPYGVAAMEKPDKPEAFHASPGLRILLAEDDPSNQVPIQKMLEKAGHAVTLAENGGQAVALLQEQNFDCILMDIQMPVMDGVEATRMIRTSASSEAKRKIPIIALTAYAMRGDRERFLKAGMDDYLAKPLTMADLKRMLLKYSASGR
jgi:PAS domain S-box-containing protein